MGDFKTPDELAAFILPQLFAARAAIAALVATHPEPQVYQRKVRELRLSLVAMLQHQMPFSFVDEFNKALEAYEAEG